MAGSIFDNGNGTVSIIGPIPLATNAAQETSGNLDKIAAADGTPADAAYAGSGSSTVIAALKGLYAKLAGTLTISGGVSVSNFPATQPVSGSVTANAGTNLNTSLLALEAGHLATIDTSTAAVNTATGAQADAAWSGTGSSSIISALKAIYAKVAGTLTVTANAGTNLNTSLLALEGGGNLATLAGGVSSSVYQANIKNVNGNTVNTGTGASGSGTARVTTSTDSSLGLTTSGTGATPYLANAIKTAVTISSAAGKFFGEALLNIDSVPTFLQVFDTTSAVTLGTTVPNASFPFPANSTAANGVAARFGFDVGMNITNGIKAAATTTLNGSTTSTNGLSGTIFYK